MTEHEVAERTRKYLIENFLYMRRDFRLQDDDPLLAKGVIDSLGVMEVVEFVAKSFEIEVEPAEITEDNFGTVTAIARYVVAKRSGSRVPTSS